MRSPVCADDDVRQVVATQPGQQRPIVRFHRLAQHGQLAQTPVILQRHGERLQQRLRQPFMLAAKLSARAGDKDQQAGRSLRGVEWAGQDSSVHLDRQEARPAPQDRGGGHPAHLRSMAPLHNLLQLGRSTIAARASWRLPCSACRHRFDTGAATIQPADQHDFKGQVLRQDGGDPADGRRDINVLASLTPNGQQQRMESFHDI